MGPAEPRRRPAADRGRRPAAGHCVWLPGNDDQRDHLLPWLISSKTQLAVDRGRGARPRQLAVQLAHARAYCEMAQPAFVRDWGTAEAAGGQSRAQLLQRLRSVTEMQKFLSASAAAEPAAAASGLLDRWERHYSAPQDSLAWERLVSRRHLYIGQLPGDALPPARQQRHLRHSRLQLVEAALGQERHGRHPAAIAPPLLPQK